MLRENLMHELHEIHFVMPLFSDLINYSHEASHNYKYLQCKFSSHNWNEKNIPCVRGVKRNKIVSTCHFFALVLIVLIRLISTSEVGTTFKKIVYVHSWKNTQSNALATILIFQTKVCIFRCPP